MKNKDSTERRIEIMEAAALRIHKFGTQELTIKNLAPDLGLSIEQVSATMALM